jgi:hypothetical protein
VDKYRKFGPFGNVHNIGIALRTSSQLLEDFYEAQRQTAPNEPALVWVQNFCNCWQSEEAVVSPALLKRTALNRMLAIIEEQWPRQGGRDRDKPAIPKEKHSLEEWKVVAAAQKILQPFKVASGKLQGEGIVGDTKIQRLLKVYIKLGWKKLNYYHGNMTSTAYVAADLFHPCKTCDL